MAPSTHTAPAYLPINTLPFVGKKNRHTHTKKIYAGRVLAVRPVVPTSSAARHNKERREKKKKVEENGAGLILAVHAAWQPYKVFAISFASTNSIVVLNPLHIKKV